MTPSPLSEAIAVAEQHVRDLERSETANAHNSLGPHLGNIAVHLTQVIAAARSQGPLQGVTEGVGVEWRESDADKMRGIHQVLAKMCGQSSDAAMFTDRIAKNLAAMISASPSVGGS